MNIDLHIHTSKSDGILTPKEVIDEAVKNNVNVISICDHDTIEAYTDSLLEYAKKNNIKLIYGVEISTKYKGYGYHVLGYNIDIFNKDLKEELSNYGIAIDKTEFPVEIELDGQKLAINNSGKVTKYKEMAEISGKKQQIQQQKIALETTL